MKHLWVGAELHSPEACPAHLHGPHVEQVGAHGTAHGESVFTAVLTQTFIEWVFFFSSGVLEVLFSAKNKPESHSQQATMNKVSGILTQVFSASFLRASRLDL